MSVSKILYNEGRVVGYSAYEQYVRQVLADDPTATPATEREWLASTLAMGTSMLLRVGSDSISGAHYRDIQFPSDSKLCAAGTIVASVFLGEGYTSAAVSDTDSFWATRVSDYGNLISNISSAFPQGDATHDTSIPVNPNGVAISGDTMLQVKSYMQITDGIVIQPGTWMTNTYQPPHEDFKPNYGDYPRLRLSFADAVQTPFYILLVGFTNRGVVRGVSGSDSALTPIAPSDGDFLGPAVFPWAAKVIFTAPPLYLRSTMTSAYERELPSGETAVPVTSTPIIDMASANPADYYAENDTDAPITQNVTSIDVSGDAAAVIATVSPKSGDTELPPAMYGGLVATDGESELAPLDSVAPGTMHLYQGDTSSELDGSPIAKANALETVAPGAKAFVRDDKDYVVQERDAESEQIIPVAKVSTSSLFGALSCEPKSAPLFFVEGTLRDGITTMWTGSDRNADHNGGEPTGTSRYIVPDEDSSRWYLDIDESIANEYTLETITISVYDSSTSTWSTETRQGISGATAVLDMNMYCGVGCMVYKRITGKFSEAVKNECGYAGVYDTSGNPTGVFASDGIWSSATKDMFNQIDAASRKDYYALIPSSPNISNAIAWPVRTSDNMVDVTIRYQFRIIVNGSAWNVPSFKNTSNPPLSTLYIGSWWNSANPVYNSGTDTYTATRYQNGWAKIDTGAGHPLTYNLLTDSATGQVYQQFAMLPVTGYQTMWMETLFGTQLLTDAGIKSDYFRMSVEDFLNMALYTDMGTGELLPAGSSNILQPINMYTNGKAGSTYIKENIEFAFSMSVANSASTVKKTQLLSIPESYKDVDSDDPMGLIIQTGRLQGLALSMADANNTPYQIYGSDGSMEPGDDSKLSWYYLLLALTQNQKIDLLGEILRGLKANVTGSGPQYIEIGGVRLYLSSSAPTGDIPEGSVGIGW